MTQTAAMGQHRIVPQKLFFKKQGITSTEDDSTANSFLGQPPFQLQDVFLRLIISRHHCAKFAKSLCAPETPQGSRQAVLSSVTSSPAPGRKLLTVMVRPGAGKGASITLRMNGCTRAGDISRLFSTSSRICRGTTGPWVTAAAHRRGDSVTAFPWRLQHRATARSRLARDPCEIRLKCLNNQTGTASCEHSSAFSSLLLLEGNVSCGVMKFSLFRGVKRSNTPSPSPRNLPETLF